MSEIRLLTSSDEHLSDQVPGFRKDDYRSAILSKLQWQGEMAKQFSANAVLRGGDFFHVKKADRTSMATLIDVIAMHKAYPCPTFAVAGNHDMVYGDPSTLSRQPLGVLYESGAFGRLTDQVFESGTLSVRVVGIEYDPDMNAEKLSKLVASKGHTYTVAVVHALAEMMPAQRTQSFFNETIMDYRDMVFPGCPDVYVLGHYHKDQSVQEHLGIKFVNLGAIARGALTIESLAHEPKVSLMKFDSSGVSIEPKVVPHGDAKAVFDLDRKQVVETRQQHMSVFLEKLRLNASMVGGMDLKRRMAEFLKSDEFTDDEKESVKEVFAAAEAGQEDL